MDDSIKQGWVVVLKENAEGAHHLTNWKKRWMTAGTQFISFSLKKENKENKLVHCDMIQNVRALADYKGKQHVFKVGTKSRVYIIATTSDDERSSWISAVQSIMPRDIRKTTVSAGVGVAMIATALVSTFEKVKLIGTGGFSTVYLVRKQGTNKYYAMKVIREGDMKQKNMEQEIRIMARINNPFLVKLYVSFKTQKYLYFVMDFVNGGGLYYYLEKENSLDEERARFYTAEIICGLEYLHSRGIVYRDLKPENILISYQGHIVLSDFGLSKTGLVGEDARTNTRCGTPYYVAPEIVLGEEYTKAVDFWSLGVVLYEMLFGTPPFFSEDAMEIYKKIVTNDYSIDSDAVSEDCQDFIVQLLGEDPKQRLTDITDIKRHPFFSSLDWEKLKRQEVIPPYVPKVHGPDDTTFFDADILSSPIEHDDTEVSEYSDWTLSMQNSENVSQGGGREIGEQTPQKTPLKGPLKSSFQEFTQSPPSHSMPHQTPLQGTQKMILRTTAASSSETNAQSDPHSDSLGSAADEKSEHESS